MPGNLRQALFSLFRLDASLTLSMAVLLAQAAQKCNDAADEGDKEDAGAVDGSAKVPIEIDSGDDEAQPTTQPTTQPAQQPMQPKQPTPTQPTSTQPTYTRPAPTQPAPTPSTQPTFTKLLGDESFQALVDADSNMGPIHDSLSRPSGAGEPSWARAHLSTLIPAGAWCSKLMRLQRSMQCLAIRRRGMSGQSVLVFKSITLRKLLFLCVIFCMMVDDG